MEGVYLPGLGAAEAATGIKVVDGWEEGDGADVERVSSVGGLGEARDGNEGKGSGPRHGGSFERGVEVGQ